MAKTLIRARHVTSAADLASPAVLVAMAAMAAHFTPGRHDAQRLVELVAAGALGLLVLFRPPRLVFSALSASALLVFFILGAVSCVSALVPRLAVQELGMSAILVLMAMCVASDVAQHGSVQIERAVRVIACGAILYLVNVLLVYIAFLTTGVHPSAHDLTPGFSNYRFLNHAQTASLPLLVLLLALTPKHKAVRGLWLLAASGWWMLVLASSARGTMLGLACGSAAMLALRTPAAWRILKLMLLTGILGGCAYLLLYYALPQWLGMPPFGVLQYTAERTATDATSGRGPIWARAVQLMLAHPWLGVGPGHFAHFAADVKIAAHPHDFVLQVGSEWGVPALLALLVAMAAACWSLWRTAAAVPAAEEKDRLMGACWVLSAGALIVDGLVSGNLVMPVSRLTIALFIGCAWGWVIARNGSLAQVRKVHAGPVLLLTLAVVCYCAAPEMRRVLNGETLRVREASFYPEWYQPRMWHEGAF